MTRIDGRKNDELRKISIKKNFLAHPLASVLIECGGTRVICSVGFEAKVPPWMRAQKVEGGWLTCEYGMLPNATHERCRRDSAGNRPNARSMEIQRLIGRSLRSIIDLKSLGQNTYYVDCDVIDADGGTRCASITGASVALSLAFRKMSARFGKLPMRENIAAISVGIVKGKPMLDLCYAEDSGADVDLNVVMTESGKFVEIQGTAEQEPFSRRQLDEMLELAHGGLEKIFKIQKSIIEGKSSSSNKPRRGEDLGSLGDALGNIKL